jgi:hypothetical protein
MKIELKDIRYIQQLSEETNAFSANLFIEGIKAGTASNRGHGGPTDYFALNDNGRDLIKAAEAYCKTLPPDKFTLDGQNYEIKMNLEHHIDKLLHAHLVEKDIQRFKRKVQKAMKQSLVFGVPDTSYKALGLKFPIDMLLVHPNGKDILKDILQKRIIPELKPGEVLLNTNIPETILKDAGLNSEQYIAQKKDERLTNQKKNKGKKL